jgi:hypothetical protein
VLSQADISLSLLLLCFQDDGHAIPKDHIDLIYLILIIGIGLTIFMSMRLLRRLWWWHLLAVQKSLARFQIVSSGTMDLASLFYVGRVTKRLTISAISAIPMICCIDLPIVLLLP